MEACSAEIPAELGQPLEDTMEGEIPAELSAGGMECTSAYS